MVEIFLRFGSFYGAGVKGRFDEVGFATCFGTGVSAFFGPSFFLGGVLVRAFFFGGFSFVEYGTYGFSLGVFV